LNSEETQISRIEIGIFLEKKGKERKKEKSKENEKKEVACE
jgi:hypothetical protein